VLGLAEAEKEDLAEMAINKAQERAALMQEIQIDSHTAFLAMKGFIPFGADPKKRERYLEFLDVQAGVKSPQGKPYSQRTFQELVELREFAKAARIFKPLTSTMATRFSTSSQPHEEVTTIPKEGLYIPDPNVLLPPPPPPSYSAPFVPLSYPFFLLFGCFRKNLPRKTKRKNKKSCRRSRSE